jgi:hypothetical protein
MHTHDSAFRAQQFRNIGVNWISRRVVRLGIKTGTQKN